MIPLVSHGANLFNLCPFQDSPALYVQNVFPIGPAVWTHFPCFWIVDPPNPPPPMTPWGVVGELFLAYVHSQMNPQTCSWIWCQSVFPFSSFPILKCVTPNPPPPRNAPCGIEGRIVYSYVHSLTNPQICTKVGANRCSRLTASLDFWMCDPLSPPNDPWVIPLTHQTSVSVATDCNW